MKSIFFFISIQVLSFQFAKAQLAGTLDPSFGNSGLVITDIDTSSNYNDQGISSLLINDNQSILAIGSYSTYSDTNFSDIVIARYVPSGDLDNTFGVNGFLIHNLSSIEPSQDGAVSAILQPDGKIVCVGSISDHDNLSQIFIARFTDEGLIDSSFGLNGIVSFNPTIDSDYATSIQIQGDGKLLVGYNFIGILRLLPNGELDTSYGVDGFVLLDHAVRDLRIQNDGKLIVFGEYNSQNPHWWNFGVSRLNSDGSIDLDFGLNGFTYFDHSEANGSDCWSSWATSVAIQSDGKILLAGGCEDLNDGETRIAVARINDNGMLDPSFGIDGRVIVDVNGDFERIDKVVLQPDGKTLLVGRSNDWEFTVVRLTDNGALDISFNGIGSMQFGFGNTASYSYAGVLQADGKLVIGCTVLNPAGGGYISGLARILTDLNIGIIEFSENLSNTLIYPNPIQEQATFQYELAKTEILSISLFDMQGKLMNTFLSKREQQAGKHQLALEFPAAISSGTYLLSVSSEKGQMGIRVIKR